MEKYYETYLSKLIEKGLTSDDIELVRRIIIEKEILPECDKKLYEYLFKGWYISNIENKN